MPLGGEHETGTLVQVLSFKNLGAIVHLVLDSDADCFENVHVIGRTTRPWPLPSLPLPQPWLLATLC
jgi:hypothetical protein